jgi:hypothetical protein
MNKSEKLTYLSSNEQSIIDLSFCNERLYKLFQNWKVEDIETNSDHSYVTFDIKDDMNHNSNRNLNTI